MAEVLNTVYSLYVKNTRLVIDHHVSQNTAMYSIICEKGPFTFYDKKRQNVFHFAEMTAYKLEFKSIRYFCATIEIQAGRAAIGLCSQLFIFASFSFFCFINSLYENQNEAFTACNSSISFIDSRAHIIALIKSCTRQ